MKQVRWSQFSMPCLTYAELSDDAKDLAFSERAQYLLKIGDEELQGEKQREYVEKNIIINNLFFTEKGELLPITTYTSEHPLAGRHSVNMFGTEFMCHFT